MKDIKACKQEFKNKEQKAKNTDKHVCTTKNIHKNPALLQKQIGHTVFSINYVFMKRKTKYL